MKLICYALDADAPTIRAAPQTRTWMDGVIDNHAYRCLPLSIANSYGWDILAPFAFSAQWSGEPDPRTLILRGSDGKAPPSSRVASHFGYGIVTFQLSYLFRTEPGWDLIATGPFNQPKDGIAALTGVIETDWLSFPFTMNWQMTRAGTVRFESDEPICTIFPVKRETLPRVEPEIVAIDDHPEVKAQVREWGQRRAQLMRELYASPRALKDAWTRDYFVGRMPDGSTIADHQTKLKLTDPVDRRSS